MSTKETQVTANVTQSKKQNPKFSIQKLQENCGKLFNVTTSTFVGATAGLSGEYTVKEMKSIIETWLKKEVK